ncbi:hypothetical protein LINPERHAP2_LOCUS32506, partial [Linum perenne]
PGQRCKSPGNQHLQSGCSLTRSDGLVNPKTGQAATRGLIRDSVGHVLTAYSECMGVCSITRAELRAVVTGLLIAWEKGYRRVHVQLNSHRALALIRREEEGIYHHYVVYLLHEFRGEIRGESGRAPTHPIFGVGR